ncbi:hypothetical protein SNEBB_004754 [Seison nebaliae]|nr:hypothetical protein SNEBB_004754 [Seison nebaliae]
MDRDLGYVINSTSQNGNRNEILKYNSPFQLNPYINIEPLISKNFLPRRPRSSSLLKPKYPLPINRQQMNISKENKKENQEAFLKFCASVQEHEAKKNVEKRTISIKDSVDLIPNRPLTRNKYSRMTINDGCVVERSTKSNFLPYRKSATVVQMNETQYDRQQVESLRINSKFEIKKRSRPRTSVVRGKDYIKFMPNNKLNGEGNAPFTSKNIPNNYLLKRNPHNSVLTNRSCSSLKINEWKKRRNSKSIDRSSGGSSPNPLKEQPANNEKRTHLLNEKLSHLMILNDVNAGTLMNHIGRQEKDVKELRKNYKEFLEVNSKDINTDTFEHSNDLVEMITSLNELDMNEVVSNDSKSNSNLENIQFKEKLIINSCKSNRESLEGMTGAFTNGKMPRVKALNAISKLATYSRKIINSDFSNTVKIEEKTSTEQLTMEETVSAIPDDCDEEVKNLETDPSNTSILFDEFGNKNNEKISKTPFIKSLFVGVPGVIRFCGTNTALQPMPKYFQHYLKWRVCPITPIVVKQIVKHSGFKLSATTKEWLGTWGRHMKPHLFKYISDSQKVNHIPSSFQIGRKDRLWRNVSHMQNMFSKTTFDFLPQTYILPHDYQLFKFELERQRHNTKWIIKPPASARGIGIKIVNKLEQIPVKKHIIVQSYVARPLLINGYKFDLRLYVLVTSCDPLKIYIHDDGLVRFASRKYSISSKTISDKFMHLTNYSINRKNNEYQKNDNENLCTGHKWSLATLWKFLKTKNIDVDDIIKNIHDVIVKSLVSVDVMITSSSKAVVSHPYSIYELFGYDILLDHRLKPWLIEVNVSPSLHSTSDIDVSIKSRMMTDLLNTVGFQMPESNVFMSNAKKYANASTPTSNKNNNNRNTSGLISEKTTNNFFDYVENGGNLFDNEEFRMKQKKLRNSTSNINPRDTSDDEITQTKSAAITDRLKKDKKRMKRMKFSSKTFPLYVRDRRLGQQKLSSDEKSKHVYFLQNYKNEQVREEILEILTPDDIRCLIGMEDEYERRGAFAMLFPFERNSKKYLDYFEVPRYYNILACEWFNRYHQSATDRKKGISLLNSYCRKRIHLDNPTEYIENKWSK